MKYLFLMAISIEGRGKMEGENEAMLLKSERSLGSYSIVVIPAVEPLTNRVTVPLLTPDSSTFLAT